ncbi:hypothetical protein EDEG_00025 [Edhazardia aedis USNM 41457]|uniref:Uncharacterized protein n=1 Tax=Edhazardia aedis (strain USNM 41457) TaxID=1003232 RepID=J9D0L8_EDHAE|nr:hypothetical protein EDEG_00025 [Edhazardia aedis USNM 41457]|eukprot:EJW01431.1 hypothetical protein EDEG_00025 [Edhazardia aedis USNM 41457]
MICIQYSVCNKIFTYKRFNILIRMIKCSVLMLNAKFITASSFESQNVTYSNGRSFKKQKLEQKKHHENPAVLTFISPEINKLNFEDRKKASPKDIKIFEKKIIRQKKTHQKSHPLIMIILNWRVRKNLQMTVRN